MEARRRVIPNCVYASNPYHECTETCLKRIAEVKPQKKNSGPIPIVPLIKRKNKKEPDSGSFKESDNQSVSKGFSFSEASSSKSLHSTKESLEHAPEVAKPDLLRRTPKEDAMLTSTSPQRLIPIDDSDKDVVSSVGAYFDFAFTGSFIDSSAESFDSSKENIEPTSNGNNFSDESYPGKMQMQDSSVIIQKPRSPQSEPASYSSRDANLISANPSISKEGNDDEDGSDGEVASVSSEPLVAVEKYRVKESLASTLSFIIDKHGDIAADCRLQSLSMRSCYLECVCIVVQKLKATPIKSFTKSMVKELSKILKDVESAQINVAWLHGVLDQIAEDIDLISEHTKLELAKSNCDREIESARKELESKLETLALKEKEIAVTKAQIAKTRGVITELELKSSELSWSLVSVKSKVDDIDGISLRRVMRMI